MINKHIPQSASGSENNVILSKSRKSSGETVPLSGLSTQMSTTSSSAARWSSEATSSSLELGIRLSRCFRLGQTGACCSDSCSGPSILRASSCRCFHHRFWTPEPEESRGEGKLNLNAPESSVIAEADLQASCSPEDSWPGTGQELLREALHLSSSRLGILSLPHTPVLFPVQSHEVTE